MFTVFCVRASKRFFFCFIACLVCLEPGFRTRIACLHAARLVNLFVSCSPHIYARSSAMHSSSLGTEPGMVDISTRLNAGAAQATRERPTTSGTAQASATLAAAATRALRAVRQREEFARRMHRFRCCIFDYWSFSVKDPVLNMVVLAASSSSWLSLLGKSHKLRAYGSINAAIM